MLCILSLLYEEHLSHRCPYNVCLKVLISNFFIFLYIRESVFLSALTFWKRWPCPDSLWPSVFPNSCHLLFWGHCLDLLTSYYFVLSFLHCLKSCPVAISYPSKSYSNSLVWLKGDILISSFQNRLLGKTFCPGFLSNTGKFSSGGLSGAVQSVRQNPKSESTPPHMDRLSLRPLQLCVQ